MLIEDILGQSRSIPSNTTGQSDTFHWAFKTEKQITLLQIAIWNSNKIVITGVNSFYQNPHLYINNIACMQIFLELSLHFTNFLLLLIYISRLMDSTTVNMVKVLPTINE